MRMSEKWLVEYRTVELLFNLDEREADFNRVLIRSANRTVENFLDRSLLLGWRTEWLKAEGETLTLKQYPVRKVAFVRKVEGSVGVEPLPFVLNEEQCTVLRLPGEYDKGLFEVKYLAGYNKVTLPAPITEAIVKLFLYKRTVFLDLQKGIAESQTYANMTRTVPGEIQELLKPYARKRL